MPEIATRVGLHPNTVRFHLAALINQGLVTQQSENRDSRGRPRILYRVVPSRLYEGRHNYQLLAQVLVSYVTQANGQSRRRSLTAVADHWGRRLAQQISPLARAQTPSTQLLVDALERVGFAPEVQRTKNSIDILTHHCPFREAAEQNCMVVCAIHLGLMQGLIKGLKAPLTVTRLEPFVRSDLCVSELTIVREPPKGDRLGNDSRGSLGS